MAKEKWWKLRERGTSDKTNKSRQDETRHGGRKEDIEGEKIQDKTLKEKRRQRWRHDKTRQDTEGDKTRQDKTWREMKT